MKVGRKMLAKGRSLSSLSLFEAFMNLSDPWIKPSTVTPREEILTGVKKTVRITGEKLTANWWIIPAVYSSPIILAYAAAVNEDIGCCFKYLSVGDRKLLLVAQSGGYTAADVGC